MTTQNFHRQLLDNLTTALLLVGQDLRVSYINASAQVLLELSETRSVGACIDQLFPHQDQLMAELKAALRDSSPYTNRGVVTTIRIRADTLKFECTDQQGHRNFDRQLLEPPALVRFGAQI